MIVVNSAIMQDKLKKLIESIDSAKFTFIKKEGIKLCFSCDLEDDEAAIAIAKKAIKSDPIASTLLISVKSEN